MKTYCIYHGNCFDGICSAWVVSKVYPDAVFIPMFYSDHIVDIVAKYNIEGGNRVVMVDFSLKRHDMEWLSGVGELLVLDHHKTAEKELEGLPFAHFDMKESGASLAWKHYFHKKDAPKLVRYVKDRDLWLFREPNSEEINSYIQSFPMTIESYEELYKTLEDDMGMKYAFTGGQSILRYKQTMVETMCKQAKIQSVGGYEVPVANASMLFSEVGHELCKQYPNAPFAAYYFDRIKEGVRQYGLRSIGDFDVSEVAKKVGGGGHRNAAGFEEAIVYG